MQVSSNSAPLTPPSSAKCRTRGLELETRQRTPRKLKLPQKTPLFCRDPSSSVILNFQLVGGTPTPSLQIRTIGSYNRIFKACRRLFSQSNSCSWSRIKAESKTAKDTLSEVHGATNESGEEMDMQDSISLNLPSSESTCKLDYKTAYKVKVCASCKTRKTPLWRDAEDGTTYCNACGIRFKKYRICCPICSYIPRKDEKYGNTCCQCGSTLFHYNKM